MTSEREMFRSIVQHGNDGNDDRKVEEIVALGIMHLWKWDRVTDREGRAGGAPISAEEFGRMCDDLTAKQVASYRKEARETLADFAVRHPPRYGFWYGVGQGFIAAFLYSVFLIVMYYVLKHSNLDLFTLLGIKT